MTDFVDLDAKKGRAAFEAADRRQKPWADSLSKGIDARAIASACRIIETLRARLENELGWDVGLKLKIPHNASE